MQADQPPPSKKCKIDLEAVIMGEMLTDVHINLAQSLLKRQFDKLNGLNNTLYQARKVTWTKAAVANKLQIIHCKGRNHWIVATTVNCTPGIVKVYDSVFNSVDHETREVIHNLFQVGSIPLHITIIKSQKQLGSTDCGVFSVAYATAIAFNAIPVKQRFHQEAMRAHLVVCFECNKMTLFPVV